MASLYAANFEKPLRNLLCAIVIAGGLVGTVAAQQLSGNVRPTYQLIQLRLNPDDSTYSGRVEIDLAVAERTTVIELHAEAMRLLDFELTQGERKLDLMFSERAQGVLRIETADTIRAGSCKLSIDFENNFDWQANALYKAETDGEAFLFTQFETNEAREAFPCFDEPKFKFPYQWKIELPRRDSIITNSPVQSVRVSGDWQTVTFVPTKPIPSYLLALACGPFEMRAIPDLPIPVRVVTCPGRMVHSDSAVAWTPPILNALEKYFNQSYPYEKLDLIAAPEFLWGAMENVGAIIFREDALLFDPARSTAADRQWAISTLAHELAHMWFGNLVTLKWWDDFWLNESFASWMGDKVSHQVYPDLRLDIANVNSTASAIIYDSRLSTRAVHSEIESADDLWQMADIITYSKGQAILEMFEKWIGPDKFRSGVHEYLRRHAWGNAAANDLWDALGGKELADAMTTFIDQPGVPLVEVRNIVGGRFRVSQSRFLTLSADSTPKQKWRIPVRLRYSYDGRVGEHAFMLADTAQAFSVFDEWPLDWIYLNAGVSGYYRWALPGDDYRDQTAKMLPHLTVAERIMLINNMMALLRAGRLPAYRFLGEALLFADDSDPMVISALTGALELCKNVFMDLELRPPFALYVQRLLKPTLQRIGIKRQDNETAQVAQLRGDLLGWLADEGRDAEAAAFLDSVLVVYLHDPAAVDPELAPLAVDHGAAFGDMARFDEYRQRFERATNYLERELFLHALGRFRDPQIMTKALEYVFTGPLRPQERWSIPFALRGTEVGRELAFDWMMSNYERIGTVVPRQFLGRLPSFAGGCSPGRLQRAREFFSLPEHQETGTMQALAEVADGVNECSRLRERELQRVREYLLKLSN